MPSAAILNGGRAVRYGGADKGALRVGGRTIRDRQLEMLATLSDDIMLVGGDPSLAGDTAGDRRARWIPDLHPGEGPVAGLEAALTAARHELLIVIACDMPGVTAAFLAALLALADGQPGGDDAETTAASSSRYDVVVPRTERGYHPLCAIYRRSTCLPVATANLAAGVRAMRSLYPALRLREVIGAELAAAGDPQRSLANVNTPAEHDALESSLAHTAHEP